MKQQKCGDKEKVLKDTKIKSPIKEGQTDNLSSATRDTRSQQMNFQK